ncbi:MAG: PA domain-containing protein [Vicingaceae bacterium]|nr:PA domain-containing protein [Vicingaceae bacterium]
MKKLSLFLAMTLTGAFAFAQVIFQVQSPAPLMANYALTWADPGGNDWATPDLNNPANAVTGVLKFVDAPGGDTIACAPPLSTNLTGNIAVVYRASCEFGAKALAAQNAGALAVIIVNNIAGPPVGMGGGASGLSVTIPVIMISDVDGALLRNDIIAGNVTGFIGSKVGLFADDLGSTRADVLRARRFSNLLPLSQNASEFSVPTGAWVRNFGNQTQNNATLAVDISFGGNSIFSDSAPINGLLPNDSIYVALGTFSQASYSAGYYTMTYTITTANPDGDPNDNVISADFMLDNNIYSYGRRDENNGELLSPAGFRPATFTTGYENCIAFSDPNASRLQANGMTFSVTASAGDDITNEFIETVVYEWNDVFTDVNDANFGFANLVEIDNVFHVFQANDQDSNIYLPFNSPITLVDNQRYLYCFRAANSVMFLGFDNQLDYTTTQNTYLQPSFPSFVDGTNAFLNGFGLENVPALSVTFAPAGSVGVDEVNKENDITPYPNPANNIINIPVGKFNGLAQVDIYDVTGKLVSSENVNLSSTNVISVDVANIENGTYIFKMTFADESTKAFNVLISR